MSSEAKMNMTEDRNRIKNNNTKTEYIERPIPPKRKVKKVSGGFFGQFLLYFICLVLFLLVVYKNEIKGVAERAVHPDKTASGFNFHFGARRQNVLLMGVDVSEDKNKPFENTRSDSIYLISIAPHAKNVNVISIPRDSKVYIHNRQVPDKINHAFAYGGVNSSVKTIEQTLGVRIDHYLVVSNLALVEFINKIGGVDVYVEKDMYYHDNTANLHINLKKGVQHLNGAQAEGFMRYRKDALGDIGRIRRQQWFLNALATKMKDPGVLLKMPDVVKSISKYIQTDFSFYELVQYITLIKSIDLSQIKVATLPGEPSQRGVISYWILDPKGVQDIVSKLVYGDSISAMNRPVEAGILYVSSKQEQAQALKTKLEENGVIVNMRQTKLSGHDHIAIHNFDLPNETLSGLKSEIPELKDQQTVYDIIGINKAARDFTIVLAGS